MFAIDNIKLATRNFKTRKLRSFLTILGISIGIGTILFLVSLGYGLQKMLIEKIATSDAILTLDVSSVDSSIIRIDKTAITELSQLEGVVETSPQQSVTAQLAIGDGSTNVTLYGVKNSFFRLGGINLASGELFLEGDKKIILSSASANLLGFSNGQEALGKEVDVSLIIPKTNSSEEAEIATDNEIVPLEQKLTVAGIVDDDSNSFSFIPLGILEEKGLEHYDWVKVKVSGQDKMEEVRSKIIDKGLNVSALSDTVDQANKIFNVVQIVLAVFGIVALIVSAIGMFNTMTITLLERTVEIGIMKSLGASNREIKFLFLTESILIGFLGGVGGILIGFLSTRIFNFGINFLAKNLGGQMIDVFYTPFWFVAFIAVFSMLIGLLTGVYPAQRASKLNPLVALRYK